MHRQQWRNILTVGVTVSSIISVLILGLTLSNASPAAVGYVAQVRKTSHGIALDLTEPYPAQSVIILIPTVDENLFDGRIPKEGDKVTVFGTETTYYGMTEIIVTNPTRLVDTPFVFNWDEWLKEPLPPPASE